MPVLDDKLKNVKLQEKKLAINEVNDHPPIVDNNLFSLLNLTTKNLVNNTIEEPLKLDDKMESASAQDLKLKRINRGYSARRYLRNLTKNWDQDLLDNFISDGKLNEDTVYEKTKKASKRKRVEDDLTILPQAYTFDQSWVTAAVSMKGYKFLKVQDFTSNKG